MTELGISRHEPSPAVVGSASAHGGKTMVMLGKKSLLGLGKLGIADTLAGDVPDLGNDFFLGRITLGRIGDGADIDHSLGRSE